MNILERLIEQAKNPTGFIGNTMLKIMSRAHKKIVLWALSKVLLPAKGNILDVGCGGGNTLKILNKTVPNSLIYCIDYSNTAILSSRNLNKKAVENKQVIKKKLVFQIFHLIMKHLI